MIMRAGRRPAAGRGCRGRGALRLSLMISGPQRPQRAGAGCSTSIGSMTVTVCSVQATVTEEFEFNRSTGRTRKYTQ